MIAQERTESYGDTWRLPGRVVDVLQPQLSTLSRLHPDLWWPWIAILIKLVRLLNQPTKRDSWEDIIGYANLALSILPLKPPEQNTKASMDKNTPDENLVRQPPIIDHINDPHVWAGGVPCV